MVNISFSDDAFNEFINWGIDDKRVQRKILELIKSISKEPFGGLGKPEPLINDKEKKWSRRINDKDRLVYKYSDGLITIYQCKGHYEDK